VRACVVAKGQVLGITDFPELGKEQIENPAQDGGLGEIFKPNAEGKLLTLDQVEERYISKVIQETTMNKGEICETLGVSRPTLERKLEKYGISFERE